MQVKNISARGWWVMGTMVKPGETATVEATKADIGDNPDLVIVDEVKEDEELQEVAETVEQAEPEAQADQVEDIGEVVVEAQETKEVAPARKPGRPPKAE